MQFNPILIHTYLSLYYKPMVLTIVILVTILTIFDSASLYY